MGKLALVFALAALLLSAGCTQQGTGSNSAGTTDISLGTIVNPAPAQPQKPVAENSDTVWVTYLGFYLDEKGQPYVFDERKEDNPMEFTLGVDSMIDGFEEGVLGMAISEERSLTIPPEKGYGEWNAELVQEIDLNQLTAAGIIPQAGLGVRANGREVRVVEVDAERGKVKIDFNHELAGKTIYFSVKVVAIKKGDENGT